MMILPLLLHSLDARPWRPVAAERFGAAPAASAAVRNEENGAADYPWRFDGRLWFRPSLVRTPSELPGGLRAVGFFGWSVGGVVALEYDDSPVGPYREYVRMGALVTKRGALGQWGRRLYVSTAAAEEVCRRVWSVPAEHASIEFAAQSALRVDTPPPDDDRPAGRSTGRSLPEVRLSGWDMTRHAAAGAARRGALPVLWTPSIKALWAPLVPLPPSSDESSGDMLPLHRLRLSASSLRLHVCGQPPSDELGTPLPLGLSVDGLRIEIGRREAETAGL